MVYRTPKKIQEQKEQKRALILEAAVRVFVARGYHGASVKDIVEEAGISVGSFYFYFKNKESIFEFLYDEIMRVLLTSAENACNQYADVIEKVCRATFSFLRTFQDYKDLVRIMLIEAVGLNPRFEKKRAESTRMFSAIIEKDLRLLQDNGAIEVADTRVAALAYSGTFYNLVIHWLHEDHPADLIDCAFPLAVYNLRALNVNFDPHQVRRYFNDLLKQFPGRD